MYILLTDRLTCPRCGPSHGLILLADRIEERRVLEGALGCANCRERYSIHDGFADLRPPPTDPIPRPDPVPEPGGREPALRLGALMGVADTQGFGLVVGPDAVLAPVIAELVEGLEVVTSYAPLVGWTERAGVSRLATGSALPFTRGALDAVALTGESADAMLERATRVVAPLGRLVLDPAPDDAAERLDTAGFSVAASQDDTVVAKPR